MARTTPAQYFIRIDTYWQNSPDHFVGPFNSRESAQVAIENIDSARDNVWLSTSMCGGDIRSAVRVYPVILTTTEAKRSGMRNDYSNRQNTVPVMPSRENDLFTMLQEARGPY
jgi:hypothetical protein